MGRWVIADGDDRMESRDEGGGGAVGGTTNASTPTPTDSGGSTDCRPEETHPNAIASSSSNSYDYVIVGAGPSCAGLLHGILTTRAANTSEQPVVRIAVLERGPLESAAQGGQRGGNPPPQQWFRAAHTPPPTEHDDNAPLLQGTTAHGRKLTVPIGQGVDGTTRIHALLCLPPSCDDFHTWPEPFRTHLLPACQRVQATLHANNALTSLPIVVDDDATASPPSPSPSPPPIVVEWTETTFPSRPCAIPMTIHRSSSDDGGRPDSYQRSSYMEGLVLLGIENGAGIHNCHTSNDNESHRRLQSSHANVAVEVLRGHAERLLFAPPSNTDHPPSLASQAAANNSAIVGVEYRPHRTVVPTKDGQMPPPSKEYRTLLATRDVVLCAGALETPALLLVSGIGSNNETNDRNDQSLPVGRTLRDHAVLSRAVWTWRWSTTAATTTDTTASVNGLTSLRQIQIDGSRFQVGVFDGGAYSDILPYVVSGWFHWHWSPPKGHTWFATLMNRTSSVVHHILRETLALLLHQRSPLYWLLRHYVKTVSIFHLHPSSVGQIRIRPSAGKAEDGSSSSSSSSGLHPLRRSDVVLDVTLGYADTETDLRALRTGWIASGALPECRGLELFPGPLVWPWTNPFLWRRTTTHPTVVSEARFRWFCHATCLPYFHWCGSCRMNTSDGAYPDGVVDAALRVRGYSGLRICDASVFPTTISAPTALTCAGLGYLLGATILPTAESADRKG